MIDDLRKLAELANEYPLTLLTIAVCAIVGANVIFGGLQGIIHAIHGRSQSSSTSENEEEFTPK